jgi:hypothetical protein
VTVLFLGGAAAYRYRAQIGGLIESVRGEGHAVADTTAAVGVASDAALARARAKATAMAARTGPASVELSADELAALVVEALDPAARGALDSVRVVLGAGRVGLGARIRTDGIDRTLLGPLDGVLDPWEPLYAAGPVTVFWPGRAAWRPDELVVRAFPFPRAVVPRVVNGLLGARDGVVPIPLPPTVGEVRIAAAGVTFVRRGE